MAQIILLIQIELHCALPKSRPVDRNAAIVVNFRRLQKLVLP